MAHSFARPCGNRRCRELIRGKARLCAACERQRTGQLAADPGSGFKLYRSGRWKRLRLMVLAASPLCVNCSAMATVVDHIVPIKQGGAEYDQSNLQTMCEACHNSKRFDESIAKSN